MICIEDLLTTMIHPTFIRFHCSDGLWLYIQSTPCHTFHDTVEECLWRETHPAYMAKAHSWN